MSRHIIKFLLVSIVFIFSNLSFAEPTVISWGDLSPTNGQEAKINLNKNTEIIQRWILNCRRRYEAQRVWRCIGIPTKWN